MVIYQQSNYRITEEPTDDFSIADLAGDYIVDSDMQEFEYEVYEQGVFGYSLEVWDPTIGKGWTHVDSCWGFIGNHKNNNHYIVDELKAQIKP